jgi:leader peptidase (prepilin peptidase)/N-methyltransferase
MNAMSSLDLLINTPPLLYGTVALFTLAVGSFLNVVIHRLPLMMEREWRWECAQLAEADAAAGAVTGPGSPAAPSPPTPTPAPPLSLARPGSHCPHCGHPLRAWENIPLLSFLLLRGRCSACHQPIGLRYPFVEALTAVLSVLVVWRLGVSWEAAAALLLTWGLIALAFIDADTQLLPDSITLPLLWLGLLISLNGWFTSPREAILGAALGYLFLWSVYQLFKLATGREGMGYGDFKLFALFGAWLGWQALPLILILSSLVGAVIGLILLARSGKDRHTPLPFGPYLAAAGWIALLWGESISGAYLRWSGLG